jgi:hypothetical protein
MNDADAQCYIDRYGDITGDPREHFTMTGRDQGRLSTCATNMTDIQTQRLIDRQPYLQHHYGKKGKYAVTMSRDNYTNYGYKEPSVDYYPASWEEPWFCGDKDPSDPNYNLWCGCTGRLWMGPINDQVSNTRLETFDDMRKWRTVSKNTTQEDWTECSVATFGSNPWPGQNLQCWCEVLPQKYPVRCADEGEDCMCSGHVYYGSYGMDGYQSPIDFWTMTSDYWTVN